MGYFAGVFITLFCSILVNGFYTIPNVREEAYIKVYKGEVVCEELQNKEVYCYEVKE